MIVRPLRRAGAMLLLLLELPAWACAVCQDPNDVRSQAYFDMTLFLSLFPLLAMGTIAWWLYRRFAAFEAESATLR